MIRGVGATAPGWTEALHRRLLLEQVVQRFFQFRVLL